jgi:hypothetical protein
MDKSFIKRVIQAAEDLDTSVYLNCPSFEEALASWLNDFSASLDSVVNRLYRFDFQVAASVFLEKRREQLHADYLDQVIQYVDGIDLAFSRKALQYAKIAVKLNGPKPLTAEVLENVAEARKYLTAFKSSIMKINKSAHKLLAYGKENNLITLPKYQYQFSRLALFERLTLDLAITLLKEKAEI